MSTNATLFASLETQISHIRCSRKTEFSEFFPSARITRMPIGTARRRDPERAVHRHGGAHSPAHACSTPALCDAGCVMFELLGGNHSICASIVVINWTRNVSSALPNDHSGRPPEARMVNCLNMNIEQSTAASPVAGDDVIAVEHRDSSAWALA